MFFQQITGKAACKLQAAVYYRQITWACIPADSPVRIRCCALRINATVYSTIPVRIPAAIKTTTIDMTTCFRFSIPFCKIPPLGMSIIPSLFPLMQGKRDDVRTKALDIFHTEFFGKYRKIAEDKRVCPRRGHFVFTLAFREYAVPSVREGQDPPLHWDTKEGSVAKFKYLSLESVGATIGRPRALSERPYIRRM